MFGSFLRSLFATVLLGAIAAFTASCVKLLELNDYFNTATALCEATCSAYDNCTAHVQQGLQNATAEERNSWLTEYGQYNCIEKCTSPDHCLDLSPVCGQQGASCTSDYQCCTFTSAEGAGCDGEAPAVPGACCLGKGATCTDDGECCGTTTCNLDDAGGDKKCGQACFASQEDCENNSDCCSSNCVGESCANVCKPKDEPCDENSDCCSELCTNGSCDCTANGSMCDKDLNCCSEFCDGGTCKSSDDCGTNGEECLTQNCCGTLECADETELCCTSTGANDENQCDSSAECCSQSCVRGHCCEPDFGSACLQDEDCCYGECNNDACTCIPDGSKGCRSAQDCCQGGPNGASCFTLEGGDTPTCMNCDPPECPLTPCPLVATHVVGEEPTTTTISWAPFSTNPEFLASCDHLVDDGECIAAVCDALPHCCCTEWNNACDDKRESLGGDTTHPCSTFICTTAVSSP